VLEKPVVGQLVKKFPYGTRRLCLSPPLVPILDQMNLVYTLPLRRIINIRWPEAISDEDLLKITKAIVIEIKE
jgi:hypothetical protein